jgi:hypothetical protein
MRHIAGSAIVILMLVWGTAQVIEAGSTSQRSEVVMQAPTPVIVNDPSDMLPQPGDQRCFPETGHCISGPIRAYWEANGGLPVFGYPITALANQTNADEFTGPTQWFERDRLEDHTAEGKGVLAGRLGAQKLAMEGRPWETLPQASRGPTGCRFFFETAHSLCPPFLAYWEQNGGLERFGFPISERGTETNAAGFTGTVQWFERRRMEDHGGTVLLGLLGREIAGLP